jgi:F-type H+-transporting ATPase subunit epsilon
MAENIRLEVVTPEKQVVNDMAQIVMAPGSLGEFGVLSGHTPFMTSLKTGAIHYRDQNGKDQYVFVSGGFAEALPDKVTSTTGIKTAKTSMYLSVADLLKHCRIK